MSLVRIKNLSEQQLTALENIGLGNLILVQKLAPPPEIDSDDEDEDEEYDEDEDERDDDDEDGDGEPGGGNDSDEGEESDEEESENDDEEEESVYEDTQEQSQEPKDEANVEAANVATDSAQGTRHDSANTLPVPPRMYVVSGFTLDDLGHITDAQLSLLSYSPKVTPNDPHSYHIYGKDCVHHHALGCGINCTTVVDLTQLITDANFVLHLNPNGDSVRMLDTTVTTTNGTRHGRCIAGCKRGWLTDRNTLKNMIKDYDPPTLADDLPPVPSYFQQPLCPCCIGLDLVKRQQELQAGTMLGAIPELDEVLGYLGQLNPRRTELGFSFRQLDERQWGYQFDDMLSGSEDGGNHNNGNEQWEQWDEANDPNANVQTRPASEKAIAALTRMTLKEVKAENSEHEGTCVIGTEDLEDGSIMVKLECGHIHCETCLVQWLKQFNNCPTCRHAISERPAISEA